MRKGKQETAKNVHKRIMKNREGGQMIFLGDDNWNLVLNMMIGIQMAVRSVRGFQEMIYEEPKDFGLKYYFELVPRRFGDE
jgi:1-phosphatidylinositol-4-phosphate 5-kinase